MHSSTKKAAEPKRLTKNGKVYGDLLSAEEKKKLVMQKKKDKKAKKVRKSAQQTIPYVEMCRDGICKVSSRLYTKTIRFKRHQLPARPERGQDGHLRELVRLFELF